MELLNFGWQQKLVLVTVPVSVAKQTNSLPVSWTTVQAGRQAGKQTNRLISESIVFQRASREIGAFVCPLFF